MGFSNKPSEEFEVRPQHEPVTEPVTLPSVPVKEPDAVPA